MALIGRDVPVDGINSVRADTDGDDVGYGRSYSLRCFDAAGNGVDLRVHGATFDPAADGATVGPVFNVLLAKNEELHFGTDGVVATVAIVAQGVAG